MRKPLIIALLVASAAGCGPSTPPDDGNPDSKNTAPSIGSVQINPAAPKAGEPLSCTWSGFQDAEGATDQSRASWTLNGNPAGDGPLLEGGADSGDVVRCTVVPFDGVLEGEPRFAELTVGNEAPTVTAVTITPEAPTAKSILTCSADASDPEGKALSLRYLWRLGGEQLGSGNTLQGGFKRGDTVDCVAIASDGQRDSAPLTATVLIGNEAPTVTAVTITPAVITTGTAPVSCLATGDDVDGDTVEITFTWTRNGAEAGTGAIYSGALASGDVLACIAVPNDGQVGGESMRAEVTVANSLPSAGMVAINPAAAVGTDTLTCTATPSDPDGDLVTLAYAWTVNGQPAGQDAPTLSGGFKHNDVVRCEVTPFDTTGAGTVGSAQLTIGNLPPNLTAVEITPAVAFTETVLGCTGIGASDPDGETVTVKLAWFVNGVAAGTGASPTLERKRGDTVRCNGTPNDGTSDGVTRTASAVIANRPPTLASATLDPANPSRESTLTCAGVGFADPDGDTTSATYAWEVNGVGVGAATGPTLSSAFARGDVVTCTVTPQDGVDAGAPRSASVTIGNSKPVIASVQLTPAAPVATDTLTCSANTADVDGDAVTLRYAWTKNGVPVGGNAPTLAGVFKHLDVVTCEVTPSDGSEDGSAASQQVTIGNLAPSLTGASITPAQPFNDSTLGCSGLGASDPDGELVTVKLAWTVNGAAAGTGASPSSALKPADVVACTATPNDGTVDGAPRTATVTIGNRKPSLLSVTLTPDATDRNSTLTCAPVGSSDPDGDTVTVKYAWTVNGAPLAGASGTTLAGRFVRGDVVGCAVTPTDGRVDGPEVLASVTIGNAAPSFSAGPAISPVTLRTNDTASATATAADPDGDAVTLTYRWLKNGSPVGGATSTLAGTLFFQKGDQLQVEVTATDALGAKAVAISTPITVINTPPTAPGGASTSPNAYAGDDETITCGRGNATDADGDLLTYRFDWLLDGSATGLDASTLPASGTLPGQRWQCSVRAFDGSEEGPAALSPAVQIVTDVPASTLGVNTTWSAAAAPYRLLGDVTVPANVTLTLEPGVKVIGQNRKLIVRGVLGAVGTASNRIALENVVVTPEGDVNTPHLIHVEFAHVVGGGVYPAPIGYGSLVLRDSVIEASRYLYVWYPVADSYIERNIFKNTGGVSVGTNGNRKVYVRNNVFYRQTNPYETYAVEVWAAYNTSETVAKGNSFLSTDRVALRLTYDSGRLDGTGNYWGGASDAQIPEMIFDQNDDPALTSTIPYLPVLSSPDPATPLTAGWIP